VQGSSIVDNQTDDSPLKDDVEITYEETSSSRYTNNLENSQNGAIFQKKGTIALKF
jgi:hypothetical protein